jgi:hypothetical protein
MSDPTGAQQTRPLRRLRVFDLTRVLGGATGARRRILPMETRKPIEEVAVAQPLRRDMIAISAILTVAIAFMLYPVLTSNIPPLADYSKHLSDLFVLYNLIHGTAFADMYRIHLAVTPNLAADGVILPLMELGLPIDVAGRCFLVLMLLALAVGVISLHYAAFRRMSIWPVLALPFLYQDFLFAGFLNYLLGVGLALMTVAFWRLNAGANLGRAGAVLLLSSLVLFFSHLVALLLALGLVIGVEISGLLLPGNRPTKQAWARLAVAVVATAAPLGLLFFAPVIADNHTPTLHAALQQFNLQSLVLRSKALLRFASGYDPTLDAASLAGVVGLGAYALVRRLIRFDIPSLLSIAGLVVLYLLVPDGWFGTAYLPERLPMVIFLLAVAAIDIVPARTWEHASLLLIVVVLVVALGVAVERAWQSADAASQPLIALLRTIPEGSRIYSAVAHEGDSRSMRRMPFGKLASYATIYRHAFSPDTKAANPSQWIVDRQPPYDVAPRELTRSY